MSERIDHYRVLGVLARGAMSTLYLARQEGPAGIERIAGRA